MSILTEQITLRYARDELEHFPYLQTKTPKGEEEEEEQQQPAHG